MINTLDSRDGIFTQGVDLEQPIITPFPRRNRILSDDNGELAASDEQGGSSERSGSIGMIYVSSEILN